jgi:uncharacterized membrane protein YfcA
MDLIQLVGIFCVSVISSSFGTLVGGSSLITIPFLILMGLPPHTAIGTDRIGTTGINLAGLHSFHSKGMMQYRLAFVIGIPCFIGGIIGANLALQVNPDLLKKFVVALSVLLLIFVVANPRLGVVSMSEKRARTPGRYILGAFLSLLAGIYGGFYGAGMGTMISYILIFLFYQTFLESAANMKIAGLLMSVSSAVTYAYHGAVHVPLGLAMFAGCCIGSYAGAHYSDRIGSAWIKRIFIGIVLIMVVKLLIDA